MKISHKKDKSVFYEDIMKWGYHLENSNILTKKQLKLASLGAEYLDALWSIRIFGFPFAYSDTDCIEALHVAKYLRNIRFIKKNHFKRDSYMGVKKKYLLNNLNYFDKLFIDFLCLSREISNHLGYIKKFEPNEAYAFQGLCCPWEYLWSICHYLRLE